MKRFLMAAAFVGVAGIASAQPAQPTPDQQAQGFREQILAQFQEGANLRAQLIAAQARIAGLEAASKAAQSPPVEAPKAP